MEKLWEMLTCPHCQATGLTLLGAAGCMLTAGRVWLKDAWSRVVTRVTRRSK
jgi:hypothetical protein